jgi:hypothetical protein
MNRKPPELPDIEDATLLVCLAPLMDAMKVGARTDHLVPANDPVATRDRGDAGAPKTPAEWKALADDDFGLFRTIELFLAMTEAELETAAAEFPKQIGGTIARIGGMKRRLSQQYDAVTAVTVLLERAMARAAKR